MRHHIEYLFTKNRSKIDEKMKSEILLNPDSLQKCILSLYDEDQEFENVSPINNRIFENLKTNIDLFA